MYYFFNINVVIVVVITITIIIIIKAPQAKKWHTSNVHSSNGLCELLASEVMVSGVVDIIEVYPDTFNINWQYMIYSARFMFLNVESNCLFVSSLMLGVVAKTCKYVTRGH